MGHQVPTLDDPMGKRRGVTAGRQRLPLPTSCAPAFPRQVTSNTPCTAAPLCCGVIVFLAKAYCNYAKPAATPGGASEFRRKLPPPPAASSIEVGGHDHVARVLLQHRGERVVLERLGRKVGEADGDALFARAEGLVGGERDDGHIELELLPDGGGRLEAVHRRHAQVHQDEGVEARLRSLEHLDRLRPILGVVARATELVEQDAHDGRAHLSVLHHEHVRWLNRTEALVGDARRRHRLGRNGGFDERARAAVERVGLRVRVGVGGRQVRRMRREPSDERVGRGRDRIPVEGPA
mmetsp:Transcript_11276/g.28156  ORF Transcript_11276/g.28156 Transcript_11276/m.28156 type:complete len:294 (+) Transcript_11276:288-1169(+)